MSRKNFIYFFHFTALLTLALTFQNCSGSKESDVQKVMENSTPQNLAVANIEKSQVLEEDRLAEVTAMVGDSISLEAGMQGQFYQWFKDSEALIEETDSTLDLNDVQLSDSGIYSVLITDSSGSVLAEQSGQLTVLLCQAHSVMTCSASQGLGTRTCSADGESVSECVASLKSNSMQVSASQKAASQDNGVEAKKKKIEKLRREIQSRTQRIQKLRSEKKKMQKKISKLNEKIRYWESRISCYRDEDGRQVCYSPFGVQIRAGKTQIISLKLSIKRRSKKIKKHNASITNLKKRIKKIEKEL